MQRICGSRLRPFLRLKGVVAARELLPFQTEDLLRRLNCHDGWVSSADIAIDDLAVFVDRKAAVVIELGHNKLRAYIFLRLVCFELIKDGIFEGFINCDSLVGVELKHADDQTLD